MRCTVNLKFYKMKSSSTNFFPRFVLTTNNKVLYELENLPSNENYN